jgi:hypothetical protein
MTTQQTNSRKFKFRQPLRGAFVIFVFSAWLPLLGSFLVGEGSRLTCKRTELVEGKCDLLVGTSLNKKRLSFALSALTAKVEKSARRDSESGEYCYLAAIILRENNYSKEISLIPAACSEIGANRVVSRINHFISTPQEAELDIHQGDWKEVILYGSPFLLMGILMSLLIARDSFSSCEFDLDRNCFTIVRKKWLRTTSMSEHSLDEIAAIDLETYDNGMSTDDKAIIKLKSGNEIELPHGKYSNRKLVSDLRQFLNFR